MSDFKEINKSTVYGPVKSWRFGMSLGVDPIFEISTCSFNCVYCQLGQIEEITNVRKKFVSTSRVLDDYKKSLDKHKVIDVITFSGFGEPTLALNLEEMIDGIRALTPKIPQYILTNGTLLDDHNVIAALLKLDKVTVKLDASNDLIFQRVNRPAKGVTFEKTWKKMVSFRKKYTGTLEVQVMLMPMNEVDITDFSKKLKALAPDLVQINTPKRPYPLSSHRENRGNHEKVFDYQVSDLKTISKEEAVIIIEKLKNLTGLEFQIFS